MNKKDLKRMNSVLRHRIRNTASGVKNAVTLLEKELEDILPPETLEYFPLIINECRSLDNVTIRLNKIFEDIPDGGASRISDILENVLSQVHLLFPASNIDVDCDSKSQQHNLIKSQAIESAILELLINAIESDPDNVSITCKTSKDNICFTIADQGNAPEDCEEIFLPFYTTRTKHLGIGLNIAKRCIASVQGDISATINKEKGLTVLLSAPLDRILYVEMS